MSHQRPQEAHHTMLSDYRYLSSTEIKSLANRAKQAYNQTADERELWIAARNYSVNALGVMPTKSQLRMAVSMAKESLA